MTVKISTWAALGLACAAAMWTGCGDDDDGGQACTGSDCAPGTRDAAATQGGSGGSDFGSRDAGDSRTDSGGPTLGTGRDGGTSGGNDAGVDPGPAKDASADAAPPAMGMDSGTMEEPEPPMDGDQLSLCAKPSDCDKDLGCYLMGRGQGFCTAKCDTDEDCEAIEGAEYTCSQEGLCKIDCRAVPPAAATCPDGLTCMALGAQGPAGVCKYPMSAGTDGRAYSACSNDDECNEELVCTASAANTSGYCSPMCDRAAECRRPRSGTIVPSCEDNSCVLSCADAPEGCPEGMSCVDMRCEYR